MLQLLQPLWLFGLTGIAVPVIIHLWNQKPGKVLKVGSISLVTESSKEYKKSLTLSDILLLILRCALIGALCLVLARPVWLSKKDPGKQKGWVLLSRENAPETYSRFKPVIDPLLKAGMEFHYFETGFPKEELPDLGGNKTGNKSAKPLSYWGLLNALDETTTPSIPLFLFTDNYLKHFAGTRPAVSQNLQWFTYTPSDTAGLPVYTDTTDSSPLRVTIFTGKYTEDARYLKAAIDAIRQHSKKNILLSVTHNAATIQPKQHWLFWLSDEPLVKEEKTSTVIFTYENGTTQVRPSWIHPTGYPLWPPIRLYKSIEPGGPLLDSAEIVWSDGFGYPILSTEKISGNSRYHFYSRFDPSWSELVWSGSFPELLFSLLQKEAAKKPIIDSPDKRIIDSSQLIPVFTKVNDQKNKPALFANTDLAELGWVFVFLLFFIERLTSFRHYKQKAND